MASGEMEPNSRNGRAQVQIRTYVVIAAICFLILLLLLKLIVFSSSSPVGHANRAVKLLQKGKFAESERELGKAMIADPSLKFVDKTHQPALVYIGIGNAALEGKDYAAAARFYLQALQADSTVAFDLFARFLRQEFTYSEVAYVDLGNALWNAYDVVLAGEAYARALSVNPDFVPALVNLGNVARQQQDASEARKKYNRALMLDPSNYEARVNLVSMADQADEVADFDYHLDKLNEYAPQAPLTNFFLGRRAFREARYQEALGRFEEMVKQQPGKFDVQLDVVDCLLKLDRASEAQAILEKLAADPSVLPQIRAALPLAAEHEFNREHYAEAKDYYEKLLTTSPQDPDLKFGLATSLLKLHQSEEARKLLEEMVQKYPNSSSVLNNLGLAYVQIGKLEWAKEQFEASAALDSSAFAFYNLGKIHETQGDTALANAAYMRALARDPSMFDVQDWLTEIKLETGQRLARGDTAGMVRVKP